MLKILVKNFTISFKVVTKSLGETVKRTNVLRTLWPDTTLLQLVILTKLQQMYKIFFSGHICVVKVYWNLVYYDQKEF